MTSPIHELNVGQLDAARRHDETFRAFDALSVGEAVLLVDARSPADLLREFQAGRPGMFDWAVLEAGPERFRVEIRRRDGDPSRGVSEFLEHDHRRLDDIIPDVRRLAHSGAFPAAADRFGEFSCGLNRHIEAEEQILFPAFEARTGVTQGPTVVMRAEHVEIRQAMTAVAGALAAADSASFDGALGQLTGVLVMHNMKEEAILYPMTDRATPPAERDALVREMQAL